MKNLVVIFGFLFANPMLGEELIVLDAKFLKEYITGRFDKREMMHKTIVLGSYKDTRVISEHPCSDMCPDYTIRIVRYDIDVNNCDKVAGTKKAFNVPVGIAVMLKEYCVPTF